VIALFLACVLWTALLYRRAVRPLGRYHLAIGLGWLAFTGIAAGLGFYASDARRMILLVAPAILITLWALITQRLWIDSIRLRTLTRLHIVRVGVEAVLWMLYLAGQVPKLITFEGRNQDILAGASALFFSWFAFRGGKVNAQVLGLWNLASMLLVLNIIVLAAQSRPPVMTSWPYIWLPGFIVPVVLAAHLFVLSRWWRGKL
jgi:hypothetical protein